MNALESQEIVTSVVHAISHSRHFLNHKLLYIYLVNFNNYPASLRMSRAFVHNFLFLWSAHLKISNKPIMA